MIPNHKSFNWAPERPNETMGAPAYQPVYGPGYVRWRLEVEMDGPRLPPIRKVDNPGTFRGGDR